MTSKCITWPGRLSSKGYVSVWVDGRPEFAHRLLWEQWHGPIPEGMTIDHTCWNKACLNVEHFQVVTGSVNTKRFHARRTHCKHGHFMTDVNTFQYRTTSGHIGTGCRVCRRNRTERWRERQNA